MHRAFTGILASDVASDKVWDEICGAEVDGFCGEVSAQETVSVAKTDRGNCAPDGSVCSD